jgi:uncharacterized protein (DUF2235 family)
MVRGVLMATRVILLSDGTGNSASKVWRTNVWRVFESLDLTGSDQVAIYDDGVGTSSFKPLAVLGGAFGWGLKRNVIDLYKFVCRNYRSPEDEIFAFGFSRGAFTIRIVIGLIFSQGLVPYTSESELDGRARAAYRAFRRENFHTVWKIEKPFWALRDLIIPNSYDKTKNRQVPRVRFLGLWDTVAAYGLPIDEMTRGVSEWIYPLEMPERRLCDQVERACHALSLDDERTTFHPVLWNERYERSLPLDDEKVHATKDERISQVWFAGVHSNVGGGYPDDSLAHIPLCWIMAEAGECGLKFKTNPPADPDAMAQRKSARDKDGRVYDPRRGLGGYYRYGPRKISDLCHMRFSKDRDDEVEIALPKIHESALKRIQQGAHIYAPIGLPEQYAVVTEDRQIIPPQKNPYEHPQHAAARVRAQESIWNLVWLRRVIYFATVAASCSLVLYPLLGEFPPSYEFSTALRPVSKLIRMVGSFVPDTFDVWLNAYARDPGRFVVAASFVAVLIWLGSRVGANITDRMRGIWGAELPVPIGSRLHALIYGLRTNPVYQWLIWAIKRHLAPFAFAIMFLYLGLTFASHLLFNLQDAAGLVCREKPVQYELDPANLHLARVSDYKGLKNLARGETILASGDVTKERVSDPSLLPTFKTSELCQSMGVWVERNGRYLIKFESTNNFADGPIAASAGFYSTDPPHITQKALMAAAVPLRRELAYPWFRVVARIGGRGSEEFVLDPDFSDQFWIDQPFTATRDGELFLFVNDAVLGIPGRSNYFHKWFYHNNEGATRVTITRR